MNLPMLPLLKRFSPTRMMRRWIFAERAIPGAPQLPLDVLDRIVTAEVTAVQASAAEAGTIEQGLTSLRHTVQAALTDKESPGVITEEESRTLCRGLRDTAAAATSHRHGLDALL